MSTSERTVYLAGSVSLEGPFLEKLWAAYQLTRGQVVPRHYTGYGAVMVRHDVLVLHGDLGATAFQCVGQPEMTEAGMNMFAENMVALARVLEQLEEPPLREAVLVSSARPDSWSGTVRARFARLREVLRQRCSVRLSSIEGYDVLFRLLDSGVLGLRASGRCAHLAGPEDEAIRYDGASRRFVYGAARLDSYAFRKLPHSFLPSHYWEQRYRARHQCEDCQAEGWTYAPQAGVSFASADDLRFLYEQRVNGLRRGYTIGSFGDACVASYRLNAGSHQYTIYVFNAEGTVREEAVRAMKGKASDVAARARQMKEYLHTGRFGLCLVAASEDWLPAAWAEAHFTDSEDFCAAAVEKGDDVLLGLLNDGLLSFAYRQGPDARANQFTLAGPDAPGVRLVPGRGLIVADG